MRSPLIPLKISCSLKIKGEEGSPLAKHVLEIFLDHSSFTLFFRPSICVMQKWRDTMPQYCTRYIVQENRNKVCLRDKQGRPTQGKLIHKKFIASWEFLPRPLRPRRKLKRQQRFYHRRRRLYYRHLLGIAMI